MYQGKTFKIKTSPKEEPEESTGQTFQFAPTSRYVGKTFQITSKTSEYVGKTFQIEKKEEEFEKPKGKLTNRFNEIIKKIDLAFEALDFITGGWKRKFLLRRLKKSKELITDPERKIRFEKKLEEALKEPPQLPSSYKEPTTFAGQFFEGFKAGWEGTVEPSIGYFLENIGKVSGTEWLAKWGEDFGTKQTIDFLKKPHLLGPEDMKPFIEGGFQDPRFYGRVIGETLPFSLTAIGTATLGGFMGGPIGAAVGGFGTAFAIEQGNLYQKLIQEGVPTEKAVLSSNIYGTIAAIIENAFGFSPAKIGGAIAGKELLTKTVVSSYKNFLLKELPKFSFSALKKATAEGGEEVAQSITESLVSKWVGANRKILVKNLGEEFVEGFIGSLPLIATEVKVPSFPTTKETKLKEIKPKAEEKEVKSEAEPEIISEISKIPATKKLTPQEEKKELNKLVHNKKYEEVRRKLIEMGPEALTTDELDILAEGAKEIITSLEENPVKPIETEDIVHKKIEELYTGVPLDKLLENIVITFKGSKRPILDALGSTLIRYYGLSPETRNLLIRLEGENALRKEDLLKFFEQEFPITKEEAKLLTNHQENPAKYPIPEKLQIYAGKVDALVKESRRIQEERGLMGEFFPESFIRRANAKIAQHKAIIPKLKRQDAIARHQKAIQELEEYIEFLEGLRYVPHAYLASEEIQRNILRLLPEGRITSFFRDKLTRLRGRKIATIDDAKEMGLLPEEDIRVLLASHFEYLFRKVAAHDFIENLKKNKLAVLPDEEAPDDWQKVAISQLNGYRVNPFLVDAIEDFTVGEGTSIMDLMLRPYDAVNHLGRFIFFYNPIILPFWDVFQAYAAGSLTPWKPIYSIKLITQAIKDVLQKTELYREAVKRKLYDPMEVGRFSPPVEEAMKVIINKTEAKYPGWKKAVEKITGRPVDWQTMMILPDLYRTNHRFIWMMDRILRTATLRHALNMGLDMDAAVRYANNFHANYNLFTKKSRKWLYRVFLVPTYKANMLFNLPKYLGENVYELAKNIKEGQTATPEQKAALFAIIRIAIFFAAVLGYSAWKDYYLREGYRLVKKIKPEITPEGKVLSERVITLPGPFFEWFKLVGRIQQQKFEGIFMYLAKVPQIAWSLARNRRWQGDVYYDEGASPDIQRKQIVVSILKDYFSPYGQYDIMTREEQEAMDNILSLFGMATYKRGSAENRILWEISNQKSKLQNYLKKPDVSWEDKQKAIKYYDNFVEKKIKELEDLIELYERKD